MHFLERWATDEIFEGKQDNLSAMFGVLKIGGTFIGYRYRDLDNRVVIITSTHLPKRFKNILKGVDGPVRYEVSSKKISQLCRAVRQWSFSIAHRGDGYYLVDFLSLRQMFRQFDLCGIPPTQYSSYEFIKKVNHHETKLITLIEDVSALIITQMLKVGLLPMTDSIYGIGYTSKVRYGTVLVKPLDVFANQEQKVIWQLSNNDEMQIFTPLGAEIYRHEPHADQSAISCNEVQL